MKKGIYLLPNGITLCGMTCGFYSILLSCNSRFEDAAWFIIIANIFDALDGWIARMTNSTSRFGVQLDSLSDFLVFPAATAVLLYTWQMNLVDPMRLGQAAAIFFVMCGALRLARYNVQAETAECRSFTGMPSPAAASTLAVCPLVFGTDPDPRIPGVMIFLTFLLGLLMVSEIRYHSLKEIKFKQRQPFWLLVVFAGLVFLIVSYREKVIFFAAIAYMLLGLIEEIWRRVTNRHVSGHTPSAPGQTHEQSSAGGHPATPAGQ